MTPTLDETLEIAPYNPSGWQLAIKTILGLVIGIAMAFLVFIILIVSGSIIDQALQNSLAEVGTMNPLLPLILIVIAFLSIVIGMVMVAGIYNLLYTDKYYDMGKMFSLTLFINIILFIMFVPLYIAFATQPDALFFVLAFHTIFATFTSYTAMEVSTNPNYAAVHLIGTAMAMTTALLIFAVAYNLMSASAELYSSNNSRILLTLPPVLIYFLLPAIHGIWEKIYYKFYTMGNNFFYIPSLSEVLVDELEEDDVDVSMT